MIIDTLQLTGGNHIGAAIKADGQLRFVYSIRVRGPQRIIDDRERLLTETFDRVLEELRQEVKQKDPLCSIRHRHETTLGIEELDAFINGMDIDEFLPEPDFE